MEVIQIKPKILPKEEIDAIQPTYIHSPELIKAALKLMEKLHSPDVSEAFQGFDRYLILEQTVVEGVNAKEIANTNLKEMARVTAQKWYVALHRLFYGVGKEVTVPLHTEDGRIKIAIPGGHLAFEVGGILLFFNEQQIPVDIDVVDIKKTGHEIDSMNLEDLLSSQNSTVTFYSETDAIEFLKGKKYDLVVLRNPGPVWLSAQLSKWQKIVNAVVVSNPAVIIFSTYNHVIDSNLVKEDVGLQNQQKVREYDIFNAMLTRNGFLEEKKGVVVDDLLLYPRSIYMTAHQGEEYEIPIDRYMSLYFNLAKIKQ